MLVKRLAHPAGIIEYQVLSTKHRQDRYLNCVRNRTVAEELDEVPELARADSLLGGFVDGNDCLSRVRRVIE